MTGSGGDGNPTATAVPLSADTLRSLQIPVPGYDRSAVTAGIVHLGVGGFHRAHQAMYVDRLMTAGLAIDWGICGIGVLPADARMAEVMAAQDCLYTLVVKHPDGRSEPRVIGSIVDYVFAPGDPEGAVERMADPAIRIVSLTVTEGGYSFNQVTGEFDPSPPAIAADLVPGAVPGTTFGLVTEALARRRARGIPPFTVMSCDNIQGNGHLAHRVFTSFARMKDPDLGDWIDAQVAFPNSMVDRITPVTTDADREGLRQEFAVEDAWPVICEPFTQWVLQDTFVQGRPPYQRAGVMVVDDVEPYELMKLRLINASHQALCYFGYLAGYRLVHDAASNPLFSRFLLDYMEREATPTLRPVPGIDLDAFRHEVIERFSNPGVRDTIARLCAESSDRIPKWLVPVVLDQLAAGREVTRSAAVVASWARYAEGFDEQGETIEIVDRMASELTTVAARQSEDDLAFLRQPELFGDLADHPAFTVPYRDALDRLHREGSLATLQALDGSG